VEPKLSLKILLGGKFFGGKFFWEENSLEENSFYKKKLKYFFIFFFILLSLQSFIFISWLFICMGVLGVKVDVNHGQLIISRIARI